MRRAAIAAVIGLLTSGGATASPLYRDATASSGIEFMHSNGAKGEKNYYEVMGSGACLLDADGDGKLDVYLVTSVGSNKLFRNLGGFRFADVTAKAGVANAGYGMGAFAADADNDGDSDLLVTSFGAEHFFVNDGRGVFRDATKASGISDPAWSCGAAWLDADRDGLLDLFVVNYVSVATPDTARCLAEGGKLRMYCPPRRYPRAESTFYRNRGAGKFENATKKAGLAGFPARGLGVAACDYDRDGWPDLYVANDLDPTWLFKNRGDGTFEEVGIIAGVSHSENGKALSGMGVAAGDYDNDGWTDFFVTNYVNEPNTLFKNEGDGFFLDVTATSRLGPMSLPDVGWGTEFFDYDLDGWDDLLVANGHTESDAERVDPTTTYKQAGALLRNRGNGTFEDVTAKEAPALEIPRAGRGAAFGDLDDDGDIDVVIVNQNDRALVLENVGGTGNRWIGFRVQGTKSNRDGVGAQVTVHSGAKRRTREVRSGGSYLSGNDPRILMGLGAQGAVDSVTVQWPSGLSQSWKGPAVNRYHRLVEGRAMSRSLSRAKRASATARRRGVCHRSLRRDRLQRRSRQEFRGARRAGRRREDGGCDGGPCTSPQCEARAALGDRASPQELQRSVLRRGPVPRALGRRHDGDDPGAARRVRVQARVRIVSHESPARGGSAPRAQLRAPAQFRRPGTCSAWPSSASGRSTTAATSTTPRVASRRCPAAASTRTRPVRSARSPRSSRSWRTARRNCGRRRAGSRTSPPWPWASGPTVFPSGCASPRRNFSRRWRFRASRTSRSRRDWTGPISPADRSWTISTATVSSTS